MKNSTRQIDALRERITSLQHERDAIQRQRRSRADVAAAADAQITEWTSKGHEVFSRGLHMLAAGSAASPLIVAGVAGADGVARVDVGPYLVALVGANRMREVYFAHLDTIPVGLSRAARVSRLAEINATLRELETDEERLVEESEMSGSPIARRADARPEIILGTRDE